MFSRNSSMRVDDRIERHLARLRLQHADAVVEVFVGARPAAVDARQQRAAARQRDARRQRHQRNEVAAIQRQRFDFRLAHVIAHRAAGRFEQRRFRVHIHRLRRLPQFQLDIQPGLVADAQRDAGLPVGPKPRLLRP